MRPLGEWLRQRREELGTSLDDAQEATHIRVRYLEALESDDFQSLPNPVVASGFLRNYAAFLELDPEEAADRYSAIVDPGKPQLPANDEPNPFAAGSFRPVPLHEIRPPRSRWWLPIAAIAILVLVASLLVWRGYPYISGWLSNVQSTIESIPVLRMPVAALATASHTPTVSATDAAVRNTTIVNTVPASPTTANTTEPSPTPRVNETPPHPTQTQEMPTRKPSPTLTLSLSPSPLPTEPIYTGIFIELVFTDTSWIQVTVDSVRQFQGELEAGTHRSWYGETRVELRIGNAGAVEVTVNGENLGTLGDTGDVIDRVFEIVDDQVSEATPTRLPTGTITVEPTASLSPSAIATPTLPITPTAAITPTLTITPTASATATTSP